MKKKWWLLLTALLLLGSILSWTAFQRAHTFTLSGSEEKKNEQIQPLFQTVKVSGDCDTSPSRVQKQKPAATIPSDISRMVYPKPSNYQPTDGTRWKVPETCAWVHVKVRIE